MSHTTPDNTGTQLLSTFASILELAATGFGSIDEANELLYSIEDKAAEAYYGKQA